MTLDGDPIPVPWFAHAVEPGDRNPALRPVREDEIEELDEIGPWEEADRRDGVPADTRSARSGRPPGGPDEGAALVAAAVGRAVRARRRELHLSQAAFAARTGRTQGTVSLLERGLNGLRVEDLVQIALETGRSIRLNVFPEDGFGEDMGRVDAVRLGVSGSVRVAIGPARPTDVGRGSGSDRRSAGPIF